MITDISPTLNKFHTKDLQCLRVCRLCEWRTCITDSPKLSMCLSPIISKSICAMNKCHSRSCLLISIAKLCVCDILGGTKYALIRGMDDGCGNSSFNDSTSKSRIITNI